MITIQIQKLGSRYCAYSANDGEKAHQWRFLYGANDVDAVLAFAMGYQMSSLHQGFQIPIIANYQPREDKAP